MPIQWEAAGTVVGGVITEVLAAQVLDWTITESIADVGAVPDVLEIEVCR